ncbi:hypothetical protein V6N11_017250 [Hibiscus sabdariffa]|uniref:Cupin type-1 domain-containing protein n=1 Tax=Hibiscus sabdariffa TaxID=183260 RepID=A0ABR2TXY9_9ROSI
MAEKGKTLLTGEETELKKELEGLLKVILEEDECSIDMTINSIGTLSRLTEMKLNQSVGTVSRSGKEQILRWCEQLGVAPLKVDQDIDEPMTNRCYVDSLLEKLLSPLSVTKVDSLPDLQEDLIATVLNISIDEKNKKLVAEHPVVISLLAASMRSGIIPTKRNAAAALFTLSTLDSNKLIIGNSRALGPLLELLRVGHPLVVKDVVLTIFSLCHVHENIVNFTERGIVKVIVHKISDGILVHELFGILALLTQYQDAIKDLEDPTTFDYVGFVTSSLNNHLFSKTFDLGDVFVFPIGLIHFRQDAGKTNAVGFAGLSSQNPGVIAIEGTVFRSNLPINADVLTRAFQLSDKIVKYLPSRF